MTDPTMKMIQLALILLVKINGGCMDTLADYLARFRI